MRQMTDEELLSEIASAPPRKVTIVEVEVYEGEEPEEGVEVELLIEESRGPYPGVPGELGGEM